MQRLTQSLTEWHGLRLGLLFCYEGPVSGHGHGKRGISGGTAWCVAQGWARVTDDTGVRVRATAGQWLMARPGVRIQEFSPQARLLSINFRAAFHTGEHLFQEGLSLVLEGADHPQLERCGRRLERVAKRLFGSGRSGLSMGNRVVLDLGDYLALQDALMKWVSAWSHALIASGLKPTTASTSDPRVGLALSFVQEHVQDPDLDAARVAGSVGLSFSQLNRLFLREREETLGHCIQRIRLERANHLLMRTGFSIKEVALQLGFRHQSHFTAWFRKQAGRTPTDFRADPLRARCFQK
jgi:AraC-like DNA-binding protein